MKYPQIKENHGRYPTRWMCSALGVSDRGFRAWRCRDESQRRQQNRRLLIDIRSSFEKSERTYGSPRIRKDLRELGQWTSKKRVARIMRENGLVAVQRRRFKVTTQSGHNLPVHDNLLARDFSVEQPNRVWLGDITFIRTEEGWLYLAVLMDLCSRKIVGWNTANRIDRWLTLTALEQAFRERCPKPGLIHHSDRGSQGEFKWSSQRSSVRGCDETKEAAKVCSSSASADDLSGAPPRLAARAQAAVLGGDYPRII